MLGSFPSMGGIAGSVANGAVRNCANRGLIANQVKENGLTAGIVAACYSNTINCNNYEQVSATSGSVGDVVASAGSSAFCPSISGCTNSATVNIAKDASPEMATFVGGAAGDTQYAAALQKCVNSGMVAEESSAQYNQEQPRGPIHYGRPGCRLRW